MNSQEIIEKIRTAPKKTPIKVYINTKKNLAFENCLVYGSDNSFIVIGEMNIIKPFLGLYKDDIIDFYMEGNVRNSALPLLNVLNLNARIEPGAIIRDDVVIEDKAIIMMGAIINVGCVIKEGALIDMGAVLGARVEVGRYCHIGSGAVLAGVVEPPNAKGVVVEDNVLIGANAVILEGCRIGANSVVGAGAIVLEDVAPNSVVAGNPARFIKSKDEKTLSNTKMIKEIREI